MGEMPPDSAEIPLEDLFSRLEAGHAGRTTVLTPNRRLAQALQRDFDARQARAGRTAWETADILPFDAFVRRLWEDALYSRQAARVPLPLSPPQEQALWEEAIEASRLDVPLLAPAAAAAQCRQAWRLVHGWRLGHRLAMHAAGEDARAFLEWMGRYVRLTRERGFTDEARLPDVVAPFLPWEDVRKPGGIVMFGFDIVTPQQRALVEALAGLGVAVEGGAYRQDARRASRHEFATPEDELRAVARWARARLAADPGARIGIVVPDLAQSRGRVARALSRVLQPGYLLAGGPGPRPFDISLGARLDGYPLVADALRLLRLCGRETAFEDASALVRSPFVAGAEAEMALRARADAAMRERASVAVTLDSLIGLAASPGVPRAGRLLDRLAALAEYRRAALFGTHSAGEWARAFSEALRIAGFPGERPLDSAEFQVLEKWHALLAAFATLERVTGSMGHDAACGRLERMARETLFQPEAPEVPIQVLGILESAGLAFDHLWVTGLTDEAWPLAARPNPFIPAALQREARIPQADASLALALDQRITQGWLEAAGEVVVSHSRVRDDSELAPSPLVAHLPAAPLEELALDPAPTLLDALRGAGTLERLRDGRGTALEPSSVRGGTGLFKDQAACPFRAFARRRLDSRELAVPRPGLGANDRGTLLHEMMSGVWKGIGTRARLVAMEAAELDALLAASAEAAIAHVRRRRGEALRGRFARLEHERLVRIAREWLDFESGRADFEVAAIEAKADVTFAGLTVGTRIDRVDRLSQGGMAVLDYKTGEAAVGAWLGPRPDDLQLPMYALAGGEDVRAIAFARIRTGVAELCGIAMEPGLLPKVGTIDKSRVRQAKQYADWGALKAHWRRETELLAAEFLAGEARVEPKRGAATCALCDQQSFCRVAEKTPQAIVEEDDA
ncbi:MAG TPA: PD-(D/E)XK nuclease family protein [Usitatibacter sp.]|nr:PD-(D/E)XK nuclease family protein [Usitatibacter sp.]